MIKRFGGKRNFGLILEAEQEMKKNALEKLTIQSDFNDRGKFRLNFLTGDKFIHQTLFCTYSFFKFLNNTESKDFAVTYFSDGTLSDKTIGLLQGKFPQITVVTLEKSLALANRDLPETHYPFLRNKVADIPLFKKLVFPHLNSNGMSTFFDSDMLFLKRPDEFLNWLYRHWAEEDATFGITDVERSYGYKEDEILSMWPAKVKNNINSGMYSIHSANLDWRQIEQLVAGFETKFGSQYYLEQLITAIMLEKKGKLFLAPPASYIVYPTGGQVDRQEGTLHHYVNESKEFYFKTGWKKQVLR